MASGDFYRVTAQFRTFGVNWSWGFAARDDGGEPENEGADKLADVCDNLLTAQIRGMMAPPNIFQRWYVTRVHPGPELPGSKALVDGAGQAGTETLPPNTCMVLSLQSDDANLKRAGRIYLAGMPASEVVQSGFSALAISDGNDLANKLVVPLVALGAEFRVGILRTVNDGLPLDPPQFIPVDTIAVQLPAYSQRRRNSKSFGFSDTE